MDNFETESRKIEFNVKDTKSFYDEVDPKDLFSENLVLDNKEFEFDFEVKSAHETVREGIF